MKKPEAIVQNNLPALEGLRGLAAVYVLIHHARLLLTLPYFEGYAKHPEKYSLIDKALMYSSSAFKFGHEAVILFFVLSGFVIHLKQARQIGSPFKTFDIKDYFLKRALRIYPTLILSMILTIAAAIIIDKIEGKGLENLNPRFPFSSLLNNLLLIPDTGTWAFNYPMWSLKHEWFFYVIYPLLLWLTKLNWKLPFMLSVIFFALFLGGIKVPLLGEAAYTLLIWWLGAFLAELYSHRFIVKQQVYVLVALLAAVLLFLPFTHTRPLHDLLFGLIFCCLLSCILYNTFPLLNGTLHKLKGLGTFSYSVYLLHFPILSVFQSIIVNREGRLPFHLWYVCLGTALSIPILYCLYLVGEEPSQRLKKRLFSR